MVGCDKWKDGCGKCPQYKSVYPSACIDITHFMWNKKKKWFTNVKNLTLVTPSHWLADLVKLSFLKDYRIKVINNGIDLTIFKPIQSDFKIKHNLNGKYIVLGVSLGWSNRKGLDVFMELSKKLDDRFQIVLVGTDDKIDTILPSGILSIHRTHTVHDLVNIYCSASVFINPTREENFPTVNIESIACGTPVVTFNTGGSPEIIDESCGSVVPRDDIQQLYLEIVRICTDKPYTMENCLKRAAFYDRANTVSNYLKLYEER